MTRSIEERVCGLWGALSRGTAKWRALLLLCVIALGCSDSPFDDPQTDTVQSELLQQGAFDFIVPIPANAALNEVVVAANGTLRVADRVVIEADGSALPSLVNTGTIDTNIGVDTRITTQLWSRASVTLRERASVGGSLTTAGTLARQNGTTVGGPILQNQTLTTRNVVFSVAFPASSVDVNLEPDQSRSIAPGAYANVSVKSRATLHVSSGTYYLDMLNIEPQGKIVLEGTGSFVFYVRSQLAYKGSFVSSANAAPEVLLAFAGTSDVFMQSAFEGTLVAPRANVTLANIGAGVYRGAFFGKSLDLQASVRIIHRAAAVGSVQPIAECMVRRAGTAFDTVFGYSAEAPLSEVAIPVGPRNRFSPGATDRGQPRSFKGGRQRAQFVVESAGAEQPTWELDGKRAVGSRALPECSAECVQHVFDPSKPRITQVLASSPALLSRAESLLVRDTFNWEETLPVPELGPDGNPRLYYGQVYVDSKAALDALDVFRIHYSGTPLFEEEMLAIEQLASNVRNFSYDFDGGGQFVFVLVPGAVYNAIRAAALDPVEPAELFQAFQVRNIPVAEAKSSCGLAPRLECVAQAANGALSAVFGYDNPAGNPVTVPAGGNNAIFGVSQPPRPQEAFAAGRHEAVFSVPFLATGSVTWSLNGESVTARSSTPRCSAAVVARIGVDKFQPFPTAVGAMCRQRTPGEAQSPGSALPPAARVDTCSSYSYEHAGRFGLVWRGVADGEVDERAEAVERELEATDDGTQALVSDDDGPTVAFFGKLLRKVVKKVVSVGKGAVDLTRRGLLQVARLFVGSREVTVEVDMLNSDIWFQPDTRVKPSSMVRAWGSDAGKKIQIPGMEVRASYGPFLSLGTTDADSRARVRVLNGAGSRICFTAANGAAQLVNSWFLAPTQCDYTHPLSPAGQQRVPGSGVSPSPDGRYHVEVYDGYMNVLAQLTDANAYVKQVAKFDMKRAEVIVGGVANLIGEFNDDRASAPCWSFSWASDATVTINTIGVLLANQVRDYVLQNGRIAARYTRNNVTTAGVALGEAFAAGTQMVNQLAGTALQAEALAALALVNQARATADAAALAALRATQATDDAREALAQVARLRASNSPRLAAANTLAEKALDTLESETAAARDAVAAAHQAIAAANVALTDFASRAIGTAAEASVAAAADASRRSFELIGRAAETAITLVSEAVGAVAAGVTQLLATIVASTLGEALDLFAGGDLILPNSPSSRCVQNPTPPPANNTPGFRPPPGLCYQAGDATNRPTGIVQRSTDPWYSRALVSRRVPTHEYGHFVLCNMLERVSPVQFSVAYNEAAAGLFLGQTPEKDEVVFNEAFADFIAGQVAAATDYAGTVLPGTIPPDDASVGHLFAEDPSKSYAPHYCPTTPANDCFESNQNNRGTPGNKDTFPTGMARVLTLVHDAWDRGNVFPGNVPNNAKAWRLTLGRVEFQGLGIGRADEERITLVGDALPKWIRYTLARGSLLREGTVFPALNQTMVDQRYNWCQRCQLFDLHQPPGEDRCPSEWVGPQPTGLVCIEPGVPCPAGLTADPIAGVCAPSCPPDQHFDAFEVKCVPTIIIP